MDMISKSNIVRMLYGGVINIKFRKIDGTERLMKCTLLEHYIKPLDKKTDKVKKENEGLLSVWDVEKEGWRSFRVDSILEVYK